jgi:putative tryptophan/tyrosine transport system substrate-binding protein
MMQRREFITFLGGAAAWPTAARAQQATMPVIGYFSGRLPSTDVPMLAAFRQGLNEVGYVEGKNVWIEFRWAEGRYDRLPALADDLVRRNVAVIATAGGDTTAFAAKAATSTIPIVFNAGDDPIESGLVRSLPRPGGNLTGVSSILSVLIPKQFGLLSDLVPKATTIGVLVNPQSLGKLIASRIADVETAARSAGRQLVVLRASTDDEIDAAFVSFIQQRAEAVLVTSGPFFVTRTNRLVALAARHSLPTMYFRRELVDAGGLISYSSSTSEMYHQMGLYVGRILNGEKPGDLPVWQPTKFELVINLKTAKTLGLTIPPGVLAIADAVIE